MKNVALHQYMLLALVMPFSASSAAAETASVVSRRRAAPSTKRHRVRAARIQWRHPKRRPAHWAVSVEIDGVCTFPLAAFCVLVFPPPPSLKLHPVLVPIFASTQLSR